MDNFSLASSDVLASFEELYHSYKKPIYSYCLRMLGDIESAKDIVQQVFLTLHERGSQIRQPEKVGSWLYAVARHACVTQLQQRGKMSPIEDIPAFDSPADLGHKQEMARLVTMAVARLEPTYREAIILREYQDLSYNEIAEVTQTTIGNVKTRLFVARRKLAEQLKPMLGKGSRMRDRL